MDNKIKNILSLKKDVFYGCFFFIFSSLFSLLSINLSRLGLDSPNSLNILIILIIFKIGLSPFWFSFDKKNVYDDFIYIKISFSILLSFLSILLGLISPNIYYFFALSLILLSLYKISNIIYEINLKLLIILLIFSLIIIVNYIPWKIEYFYSPEITLYGLGGNQTMQGAAITNIFKNYNTVSLGADGTENFIYKYHYGLYIWWSSISLLSNSNSLFVIPFTQQAIIIPLILFSTFISSLAFLKNSSRIDLLFLTIFFFILFDIFSGKLHYDSETYSASLIFLILTLPTIKFILVNNRKTLLLSFFLLFLVPLISSLKLTTGYLFCALIALSFFYNRIKKINYFLIFLTFLLGMFSLSLFMPSSYTELKIWRLYSSYNQLLTYQNFFCILIPSIYLLNLLYKINYYPNLTFRKRLNKKFYIKIYKWLFNKKATYPKICIISYFASILPIFIIPVGATAVYNLAHLHWIFLIILLSFLANKKILNKSLAKLFFTSCVIIFFVILFKPANIKLTILETFFEKTLNKEINGPGELKKIIFQNLKLEKKIFNDLQLKNINQNSFGLILSDILKYKKIHRTNFAVYIPKKNLDFWEMLRRNDLPYWCSSSSFIIPALIGVQMIKGVQDPSLCSTYYIAGPSEYPKSSYPDNLSRDKICLHAKRKKINYIYQIEDMTNIKNNYLIECKQM